MSLLLFRIIDLHVIKKWPEHLRHDICEHFFELSGLLNYSSEDVKQRVAKNVFDLIKEYDELLRKGIKPGPIKEVFAKDHLFSPAELKEIEEKSND